MQVNEKDVEDEWLMIDVEEEETKQSVKDSNDYNTNNRKVIHQFLFLLFRFLFERHHHH